MLDESPKSDGRSNALKRACDKAGGQSALAKEIGKSQGQIWYWLTKSKRGVPGEVALAIEQKTGVPRGELRPDLFGDSVEEART